MRQVSNLKQKLFSISENIIEVARRYAKKSRLYGPTPRLYVQVNFEGKVKLRKARPVNQRFQRLYRNHGACSMHKIRSIR